MFTLVFSAKAFKLNDQRKNRHLKKTITFLSQISKYPVVLSQIHSSLWESEAYSLSSIMQSITENKKEIVILVLGMLAI